MNRLLVVLPNWVGDVVMATPTLRALRSLYPKAEIACLLKPYVQPLVDALPWVDHVLTEPCRQLRGERFDAAVLLRNSFSSAATVMNARIRRRIGYARDGRAMLLTDRLDPLKRDGRYVPISAIDYYLGLAGYLGANNPSPRMQLFTRPEDDARADALLAAAGVRMDAGPIIMLNSGAATKGDAKLWPAERFAALADALIEQHDAQVLLNGSPKEREILDAVHAAAKHPLIDLPRAGSDLRLLKSIITRCRLLVSNDTGARHVAVAMGTPVITLFGPTDPRWTDLHTSLETIVRSGDGRMESIGVERVLGAAVDRLQCEPSTSSGAAR